MTRSTGRTSAAASVVVAFLAAGPGLSPAGAADCRNVRGHLEETLVPAADCASPVGLCTVAQMSGHLRGEARFTASAFIASADTAATGVVFVTGDSIVVDARLGGRRGSLTLKNAAAFRTTGEGDLVDAQIITGGSGDFAGATGSLRVNGTFVDGSGSSAFEGSVCLP